MDQVQGFTAEEERLWHEEGALTMADALGGEELQTLQGAFTEAAERCKPRWLSEVAEGTKPAAFFDIPDPFSHHEFFLDLVDHPSYYGRLHELSDGQICFIGPQFRTVPPSLLSYVGWHYDVPFSNPLHFKIQLYVDDVPEEGGAFGFIPGSHRPGSGPYPLVRDPADMPGHHVYPGRAGTAVLFNSWGLHTAMVNHTGIPRRSIILIYEVFGKRIYNPERYRRYAHRMNTMDRRQLFGLEPRPPLAA